MINHSPVRIVGTGSHRRRTRLRISTFAMALALVAAACSSSDDAAPDTTSGATETTIAAAATTTIAGTEAPATTVPDTQTPSSTTAPADTTTTTSDQTPGTTAPVLEDEDEPVVIDQPRTESEGTEEDPVPTGEVVEINGDWDIVVTETDFDAAESVQAYADINPVPESGYQYVLVTFYGEYLGDSLAQPVFEWTISDGATVYEPEVPGCGVIPDSIYDVAEVGPGETVVARLCAPVTEASVAAGLELTLQPVGDVAYHFTLEN